MSITVKTQAELDAAIAAGSQGHHHRLTGRRVAIRWWLGHPSGARASGSSTVRAGSATVRASDSATVRASGSSSVEAWGSATVEAWDSSTVRASGSAVTVRAWGSATVRASGAVTVRASGSSSVEAWGSATVRAWGSATVRASDSATVRASGRPVSRRGARPPLRRGTRPPSGRRARPPSGRRARPPSGRGTRPPSGRRGSATVRASDSATVEASPLVAVYLHSGRAVIHGGTLTDLTAITETDPVTWCAVHGVAVTDGVASLYKATDGDLTAGHSYRMVRYDVGTEPTAPDFDTATSAAEASHLSPTTSQATTYRPDASRWVRVEVPVGDIVPIPSLLSGSVGSVAKCKVRTCRVVAEVDRDGGRSLDDRRTLGGRLGC